MAEQKPGIEYVITFPPASNDDTYEIDSFSVIDTENGNRPVIILLGWAGCIDKHLAKYSEMYEKRRYVTIRYTAPTAVLFVKSWQLKGLATQVLDILQEHDLQQHPIFFHIFSNGGCLIYRFVGELIQSESKYSGLNIRGCIIDSAPGKRRILKAVRAFTMSLRLNCFLRYTLGFCLLIYLAVARLLLMVVRMFKPTKDAFLLFEALCEDPNKWPQLCLYSKADKIILSEDVDAYVASRREQGVEVEAVCWETSDHVAHLRAHREAYMQKCLDFVTGHLPRLQPK